jgi:hypothetical protein
LLKKIGEHASAFAHPNPPKPGVDFGELAAAYKSPEQVKREDAIAAEESKIRIVEAAAKAKGEKPPSGRPVPFGKGSISMKDAQSLAENGMVFNDQEGKEIDLSELPEHMKITPWAYGSKIFYTIGDQVPRIITADNQRTVQPEEGAVTPASSAPTLGVARVGKKCNQWCFFPADSIEGCRA